MGRICAFYEGIIRFCGCFCTFSFSIISCIYVRQVNLRLTIPLEQITSRIEEEAANMGYAYMPMDEDRDDDEDDDDDELSSDEVHT